MRSTASVAGHRQNAAMADVIVLAGSDGVYLTLSEPVFESEPVPRDDNYSMICQAELTAAGRATAFVLEMIRPYRTDTLGFFETIAAEGWRGTDAWQSEYAHLSIAASSSGEGDVELVLHLQLDNYERHEYATLRVPADDLRVFTADLKRFLRIDEGHRFRPTPLQK
jgi:hypothetical protein